MRTFHDRYYELFYQFRREGDSLLITMQRAVATIQYEVRCGVEYSCN